MRVPLIAPAGGEPHEVERFADAGAVRTVSSRRSGQRLVDVDRLPGIDSPRHGRTDRRGVDRDFVVVRCSRIRRHRAPPRARRIERIPLRSEAAAAQIVERHLVRVHVPDPRAAFDRHVADRHPLVHRHPLDRVAGVLVGIAHTTVDAEPADDLEDHILGVDPATEPAGHLDTAHLQRVERDALRREHVAHLRRADPERHGAERPMRRGVAVPARDRHRRLGQAQLRTDDVDDPLHAARKIEQANAGLAAVPFQRREHVLGHEIAERPPLIQGRDDMVDRRDRPLGELDLPPPRPQHVERLRSRHLVDEMQADEQLGLPVRQPPHRVRIPDLLEQGGGHWFSKWYYIGKPGLGIRDSGSGTRDSGLGIRDSGFGARDSRDSGSGSGVRDSGLGGSRVGLRVRTAALGIRGSFLLN